MENAWLDRWQKGHTGWHEASGNQNLKRWWRGSGKRVLVPLCGKSQDLIWLEALDNEVVGIELSELAVQAFFDENDLAFERSDGELLRYRATDKRITLYCGDYFRFSADGFDAHYDRGALIALPPDLRPRYAEHTSALLAKSAQQLLITVEYDQSVCQGPPYAVSADEVLSYWPLLDRVAAYDDIPNAPPKFQEAGLTAMQEVVWRSPE